MDFLPIEELETMSSEELAEYIETMNMLMDTFDKVTLVKYTLFLAEVIPIIDAIKKAEANEEQNAPDPPR